MNRDYFEIYSAEYEEVQKVLAELAEEEAKKDDELWA